MQVYFTIRVITSSFLQNLQFRERAIIIPHCLLPQSVFFALIILFITREKKYWQLRVGFIVLSAFMLIPIGGSIFNGFGYPVNRWMFGYAFLVSLITVVVLPKLYQLSKSKSRNFGRLHCCLYRAMPLAERVREYLYLYGPGLYVNCTVHTIFLWKNAICTLYKISVAGSYVYISWVERLYSV